MLQPNYGKMKESLHRRNVSGAPALFNVPPLTSVSEQPVHLSGAGADDGADGEHHRTKRDIGAIA